MRFYTLGVMLSERPPCLSRAGFARGGRESKDLHFSDIRLDVSPFFRGPKEVPF